MKRLLYIWIALMALASCHREPLLTDDTTVPDGYTRIRFGATLVDPSQVTVRAVDPDGLGVNNMTLFCFNEFGLYISSETAILVASTEESGTYEAVIPNHTQIIHFLGNHSEGLYDESDFPGQTENMVIANMEGGSGMLVYWSRFEIDHKNEKDLYTQLAELKYTIGDNEYTGVKLIRNQAKVSIANWKTDDFTVTGFRTVNIPAFGTVAPHHPNRRFEIVDDWESIEDFVTLPDNKAKLSDIIDINTKPDDYIFETDNEGDNLVSVIIKGSAQGSTQELYYRVVMQNPDGSSFMIRRNHHYKINIVGRLSYGNATFEEALTAPATNNAWISIDSWVNEITNGMETLWVEKTSYVLSSDEYAGKNWTIPYTYTNTAGNTAPTVTWIDNNVAYNTITNNYDTSSGEGSITLNLHPMYEENEQQEGTLLIKHGKLQRTIQITVTRTQKFTPAWISAQVYSGSTAENVTVMFTIPETCPEALFPFTVLISANHLDVRSSSGQQLPVLIKGEEGYFGADWEGINYKYAYTVEAPGKHRLFMHTILQHEDGDMEHVHIEAPYFETITKTVTFTGYGSHKAIFVDGLHSYGNHYNEDEELLYMLVPQKKASPHMFTIMLKERQADGTYTAINHADQSDMDQWHRNGHDEFLFYTKYLSFYDDYFKDSPEHYEEIKDVAWECEITTVDEDSWSANGRVMALRSYGYDEEAPKYGLQDDGTYHVYMLTNNSYNKDVVRIASNNSYSKYVFANDRMLNPYGEALYEGNEYRSVIFDIAHYRPFRFAAQIAIADKNGNDRQTYGTILSNEEHGNQEELTEDITFSYEPGQKVDILLDVTSFTGSDGRSTHPFGEMFGDSFEIYIDAPMLRIDAERVPANWYADNNPKLAVDKLRRHPTIPGRFIYTVCRYRDDEREYGYTEAIHHDESTEEYNKYGQVIPATDIDQTGERKCLPFVKSAITTDGDIKISSDKETVVFWDKTFKVNTQHIIGQIQYQPTGQEAIDVPKDAFIAFVRKRTGARIGVMTIYEAGRYELNLRDEYDFDWEDDVIEFYYTTGGKTYSTQLDNLATLYEMVVNNGETILLTLQ